MNLLCVQKEYDEVIEGPERLDWQTSGTNFILETRRIERRRKESRGRWSMWDIPAGGMFENIKLGCFRAVMSYVIHDMICYDTKGEKN